MDFFDGYIRAVLPLMGVPSSAFDYADPWAVLVAFVFTSEIAVFFLSIFIWIVIKFVTVGVTAKPKHFQSSRLDDLGITAHQYSDKNTSKQFFGIEEKPSLFGVMIKGIILPICIIFGAIIIAREMAFG